MAMDRRRVIDDDDDGSSRTQQWRCFSKTVCGWIYIIWDLFGCPRELTGAVDLMTYYKLLPHHEFFCKKSLPVPVVDTHYLHNVVGDTEIRKGEGMQLDQLIQNASYSQDGNTRIQPFDLDALKGAFHLKEMTPVELPSAEKGIPTIVGKSKSESKDKDKKHKRHKDKDREKDKEHKKHKHRHKDRSNDKDKENKKDKSGHQDSGGKHHEKIVTSAYYLSVTDCFPLSQLQKRKHDDDEDVNDIHRHKKSKHKSAKIDDTNVIKVAGAQLHAVRGGITQLCPAYVSPVSRQAEDCVEGECIVEEFLDFEGID
ncbi:hypothetical protein Cgig2_004077 [Carnegiea gigantea]|uniref:Mediator of RNA polymerase II transcription subunit 19a n=1 Tax=Carnegiea gigantea TaxID=171969 RepID=A0A9Q1QNR3_9CARY|nr:hypothetical protein Cgig2_004077 [Carnegiea gigantea]